MPAISLKKRTTDAEKEVINMLKTALDRGVDLGEVCMQFVVVIDASTSMENRYRNHEVQQLVERVLALSLSGLDDDGKIQVFFSIVKPSGLMSSKSETIPATSTSGITSSVSSRTPATRRLSERFASTSQRRTCLGPTSRLSVSYSSPTGKRAMRKRRRAS